MPRRDAEIQEASPYRSRTQPACQIYSWRNEILEQDKDGRLWGHSWCAWEHSLRCWSQGQLTDRWRSFFVSKRLEIQNSLSRVLTASFMLLTGAPHKGWFSPERQREQDQESKLRSWIWSQRVHASCVSVLNRLGDPCHRSWLLAYIFRQGIERAWSAVPSEYACCL